MRRYPTLQPELYARFVNSMISDAHVGGQILDVRFEAERISRTCGISMAIVERDLTEAALATRVPVELGSYALPRGV